MARARVRDKIKDAPLSTAEAIVEARARGETWEDIASEMRMSPPTLRNILRRFDMDEPEGVVKQAELWRRPCLRCKSTRPRRKWLFVCAKCKVECADEGPSMEYASSGVLP